MIDNLSFGLSSSDPEEFAPEILGFSAEVNGQGTCKKQKNTRDASKVLENEGGKPKTQVDRQTSRAIVLCGLFCSGKSTIGRELAKSLELPFFDTDLCIQAKQNQSPKEIWRDKGEKGFRDLETIAILSLKSVPSVIASGGGSIIRTANRFHLQKIGETVYLRTSFEVLWERLKQRGVPAFLEGKNPVDKAKRLVKERNALFEDFCDHIIDTEGYTVGQCVTHLVKFFGSRLGGNPTGKPLGSS